MDKLRIPHRYEELEGMGHGRGGYYKGLGPVGVFRFHAEAFGLKVPAPQAKTRPAKGPGAWPHA